MTEGGDGDLGTWTTHLSGANVVAMNAFHHLVAGLLYSLFPASETQIGDVFALFDEIDAWFPRPPT